MKKAFTLVELIVVITILSILWTIAFVSFQWYFSEVRDSVRLSDLKSIHMSLTLYKTEGKPLPKWENMYDVSWSGTLLFRQWSLSKRDLNNLGINNWAIDPLTEESYIYALDEKKNKYQLGAFFENYLGFSALKSQAFANNKNSYLQVKGDKLWIIVDSETNKPIKESIDILKDNKNVVIHLTQNEVYTWTGQVLNKILPNANCERLFDNWVRKNGIYNVYYESSSAGRDVYCDFSIPNNILTDELLQTGDFIDGNWINTEEDSVPINTIIKMESPIDSGYVLHQTSTWYSEYELHLLYPTECNAGDTVKMRTWISFNNEQHIFHSRVWKKEDGKHWYFKGGAFPEYKTLDEKIINGRTWKLLELSGTVPEVSKLSWYLWYNWSVPQSDFFITWTRLGCN